jgi:hypothetical protein
LASQVKYSVESERLGMCVKSRFSQECGASVPPRVHPYYAGLA